MRRSCCVPSHDKPSNLGVSASGEALRTRAARLVHALHQRAGNRVCGRGAPIRARGGRLLIDAKRTDGRLAEAAHKFFQLLALLAFRHLGQEKARALRVQQGIRHKVVHSAQASVPHGGEDARRRASCETRRGPVGEAEADTRRARGGHEPGKRAERRVAPHGAIEVLRSVRAAGVLHTRDGTPGALKVRRDGVEGAKVVRRETSRLQRRPVLASEGLKAVRLHGPEPGGRGLRVADELAGHVLDDGAARQAHQ